MCTRGSSSFGEMSMNLTALKLDSISLCALSLRVLELIINRNCSILSTLMYFEIVCFFLLNVQFFREKEEVFLNSSKYRDNKSKLTVAKSTRYVALIPASSARISDRKDLPTLINESYDSKSLLDASIRSQIPFVALCLPFCLATIG